MPIVRIVAKGFEGYNGIIEGIEFRKGVSTENMSLGSAERIGAFMRVVDNDTGEPLGVGQRMVNARRQSQAPREPLAKVKRTPTGKKKKTVKKQEVPEYTFTREDLESVADKEGITGLRKVAEQYEVRGRSIREIIDSLMALKANAEAKKEAETPAQKQETPSAEATQEAESSESTEEGGDALSAIDELVGD